MMRENLSSGFPTRSDTNRPVHNYIEDSKTLEISNLGRREIAVCPVVYPQALEVMAINHKNNASNKCQHSNTKIVGFPMWRLIYRS